MKQLGFTRDDLAAEVTAGRVRERIADDGRRLYNYTPKVQYDGLWNEVNRQCRGLILGPDGEVLARPFPKFFNVSEHDAEGMPALPSGRVTVAEKADGSLGIVHSWRGEWRVATRGSMTSEQAGKATEMLCTTYADHVHRMDWRRTYLFEIVYPSNRIVVDYGDLEQLVFLSSVDNQTGEEHRLDWPHVASWTTYRNTQEFKRAAAAHVDRTNFEGWVLRWDCGTRAKWKLPEYLKVHRLVALLTPSKVWELMKDGEDLDVLFAQLPDEFHREAMGIRRDILSMYTIDEDSHLYAFGRTDKSGTRKETAARFIDEARRHGLAPQVLFGLLDGKDASSALWKRCKPGER